MKNFINKTVKFILKNDKFIALLILLLILFCLNVEKQNRLEEISMNKDIIGTYIMGEEITGDAEYFVFDKNNCYFRYKQFNFIEKGEYEKIHDNLYILKNDLKEYIVNNNGEIYFFNSEKDDVQFYSKISRQPLFINVKEQEGAIN